MSFDLAWLDLREPTDHAARDPDLLARAREYALASGNPSVVDLGSGTGSTIRAFASPGLTWRLIDHDKALLAEAQRRSGTDTVTTAFDLRDVASIPFDGARLVTASALIDLVSAAWIDALAERLSETGSGLYAALNYDGIMNWSPVDPGDESVTASFNRHQTGDKGFGPALGPEAAGYLAEAMRRRDFAVSTAPSAWRLGAGDASLQAELLCGIARAAEETGCKSAPDWLDRRLEILSISRCTIGHVDVLALPRR